jgi:hypothetical protein
MPAVNVIIHILNAASLYDAIKTYLTDAGSTANVVFGWRELTKQVNLGATRTGRVVLVPGDDKGLAGSFAAPPMNTFPRRIKTRLELIAVHVWGHDPEAPNDEKAQYAATMALEDLVINAVHDKASGRYELSDAEWVVSPTEKLFGKARLFYVVLEVPVARRHSVAHALPAIPEPPATVEVSETIAFQSGDYTEEAAP